MAFAKGNHLAGSRKGIKNKVTEEVRELARSCFDKRYWQARKQAIAEGKCPPQIEGKLLAYAYGEPKQEHTLNAGITVNIGYLAAQASPATLTTIEVTKIATDIDSSRVVPALPEGEPG